jgi:exosortase A-associated hydrolase 2
MNPARCLPPRPFFLDTPRGKRFCLYHAPPQPGTCAGSIVYLHPFGEEMNMSRRMAALQSRQFAAAGYGVLQLDLFGCGDSEGELRDADWTIWREDLVIAATWLRTHVSPLITLWGLRLGAALALDAVRNNAIPASQCILWQPIIIGRIFMTQFLRLAVAADMASGETTNPRAALALGRTADLGGYELPRALVDGIDHVDFSDLRDTPIPLHWFELVPNDQAALSAARSKIARAWAGNGVAVRTHAVTECAFWAAKEHVDCPRLITETTRAMVNATA